MLIYSILIYLLHATLTTLPESLSLNIKWLTLESTLFTLHTDSSDYMLQEKLWTLQYPTSTNTINVSQGDINLYTLDIVHSNQLMEV